MTLAFAVMLGITVVATATLSGIFGMAGGIVLMGVLIWVLPVSTAMIFHGVTQAASNGYRAFLNRDAIRWSIVLEYIAGALIAVALLSVFSFMPDKQTVFIAVGSVPFMAALLPSRLALDITRKGMPFVSGILITAINLVAGVSGPLLDVFYVRTQLTRYEVVASKAVTQTISHLMKLVYFGFLTGMVIASSPDMPVLPWWMFVATVPLAMTGTVMGKKILDRMTDTGFRRWSQWLVMGIGAVMIVRGISMGF